jgi:membrane-bound lytic murein transglycosylase B
MWHEHRLARAPIRDLSHAMNRRGLLTLAMLVGGLGRAWPALGADQDFKTWLEGVRAEGRRRGLSQRALDDGLADVAPIARVIELDRRQPETTLTFDDYMTRIINQARIDTARAQLRDNASVLKGVEQRFGVQPRFIVALWGIESDFGRITGGFPVIAALATLAYDGRRSAFFREELFNALRMVDKGLVSPREMRGSWAGAMGQSQFMPSSFLAYAVDGDGDGKIDLWNSRADVFASAANYLSRVGWNGREGWGEEAKLPPGFDQQLIDHTKVQKTIAEWAELGVRRRDGSQLPKRETIASLIQPGGPDGPRYLIFGNYRVLLRWNRSLFFATAVGYLADRIGDG